METFLWVAEIILYFLAVLAIALTVLPFLRYTVWWIRIGEFPRLQIAAVCVAVLISLPFLVAPFSILEIVFLISVAACLGYQLYCFVKYLPFYPKQVERSRVPVPQNILSLLYCNVLIENRETKKLLRLIEKVSPDLILLAEVDEYWTETVAELEKKYPFLLNVRLITLTELHFIRGSNLKISNLNFWLKTTFRQFTRRSFCLRAKRLIFIACIRVRPCRWKMSARSNAMPSF